jgi:hypothetical protein
MFHTERSTPVKSKDMLMSGKLTGNYRYHKNKGKAYGVRWDNGRMNYFYAEEMSFCAGIWYIDSKRILRLTKKIEDINMPNTRIESVRNKVAEQMAHGLNAREILKDLTLITRPELVRVIMDLIENPVVVDGGSNKEPSKLDERQVATILYGLRYIEQTYNSSGYVHSDHIEGLEPMNQMEINRLCEDINLDRITL